MARKALSSVFAAMAACLLTISGAVAAQAPAGLWSSTLYRVELQVNGGAVSGSFTLMDEPDAKPGRIVGHIEADGRAFTADWTLTDGDEESTFSTLLNFADRDGVLTGYRWTEDAWPTAFALRRAVDGQLVEVYSEEDLDEVTAVSRPVEIPGEPKVATPVSAPQVTPLGHAQAPAPDIQVVVCEKAVDGKAINPSDEFTAPKSISALVKYRDLPANSTVSWLWTLDGRTEGQLSKTLEGTGWHMHGLRSETEIAPGAYRLVVALNGRIVAEKNVTVRAEGKPATTVKPPAASGTPAPGPSISVTVCERVADGEAVNPGTQFANVKELACLAKYRGLPENTELKWVWELPGGKTIESVKTVNANGWAWHGLKAAPSLPAGTYRVTVHALGQSCRTITVTVR